MLGASRAEVFGGVTGVEIMRLRCEFTGDVTVDIKQPLMRSKNLVQTKRITIHAERFQVANVVRCISYRIDKYFPNY